MADVPTYHSANLRKHRRMAGAGTFFITKNLQPKNRILTCVTNGILPADIIFDAFRFAIDKERFVLSAFVIMPSHWHAIIGLTCGSGDALTQHHDSPEAELIEDPFLRPDPTHDPSVSAEMKRLNSWISNETLPVLSTVGCAWQEGFYETRVRSTKQFEYILRYVERNPSRAGLVVTAESWRWSSANPEHAGLLLRPWPWRFEYDK